MSSILLSPISFTSPRLARRYLREVYTSNNDVLEFARGKHGLTVWEWYELFCSEREWLI